MWNKYLLSSCYVFDFWYLSAPLMFVLRLLLAILLIVSPETYRSESRHLQTSLKKVFSPFNTGKMFHPFNRTRYHGAIFIKSPFQAVIYLLFPFHGESFVLYLSGHLRQDKLERIPKRKVPSEQKNCLLPTFFFGGVAEHSSVKIFPSPKKPI